MVTLLVRQTLSNGSSKTWRLRSNDKIQTFGSSRLADLISISPDSSGIEAAFEFKDGNWFYNNLDSDIVQLGSQIPSLCLEQEQTIDINGFKLQVTPFIQKESINNQIESYLEKDNVTGHSRKFQLYIVKQDKVILQTKLLPLKKTFKSMQISGEVKCIPSKEWVRQTYGSFEVSQKTLSLEDAAHLGRFSTDQLVDEDSKKGMTLFLGATLLIVTAALFAPKRTQELVTYKTPILAQKIIVKTDLKEKRKKQEQHAAPQVVIQETPPTPSQPPTNAQQQVAGGPKNTGGGGGKIANMMSSLANGRISQLIGKVSAQAAKSGNVMIATGVAAGTGPSGRALSAVGNIERSGRDWGAAGTGKGILISTNGKGGGKSASGMGGLTAGGTGSGGVGLIEEEGEIVGGLDREVIAQYIKSQLGQILYCYERQLSANPELFGKLAVKFTIGPTGSVEQQLIGDNTLKNATVEGCILNRVANWKFPTPQGGTRVLVTYPFLFKSTN